MAKLTAAISSYHRTLAILLYLTFPLKCYGFGQASTTHHIISSKPYFVKSKRSSLFVVESNPNIIADPKTYPVIKNIDDKMEKYKKNREKYVKKLAKFEKGIEALETKKLQYLEGIEIGQPAVGGNFSESAMRSAVKAMMWRLIAGSVTFITSLKFSGSITTALRIVGSDFFSKALTMFIGERLMNKSQAGRKTGADSTGRSVAKALIWRLFAICNTLTVSFFFAKDLKMASKIAGSDAIFKTALMVIYERVWAKVEWGKDYIPEFNI